VNPSQFDIIGDRTFGGARTGEGSVLGLGCVELCVESAEHFLFAARH